MVSQSLLQSFLETLRFCQQQNNPQVLSLLFVLDTNWDVETAGLHQELQKERKLGNNDYLDRTTENILGDEWLGFTNMASAYLSYLRDVPLRNREDRFTELMKFIRVLAQAYSHNNGHILNDLVKKAALLTANLGMRLDEDLNDKTWRYAEIAHSYTIRFFNAAIQERSKDGIGKKAAAVFLANVMFKLHVKMDKTRLSPTFHANLSAALKPHYTPFSADIFPPSQRATYAYYYGRHHFSRAHYRIAQQMYQTAYDLTPLSCLQNRRLLLIHLISCNIMFGRFPSQTLLSRPEAVGLSEVFTPIIRAIRIGHFSMFEKALLQVEDFLLYYSLFYDLQVKCQVLLWRSLVLQVYRMTSSNNNNNNNDNNGIGNGDVQQVTLDHLLLAAGGFSYGLERDPLGMKMTEGRVVSAILSLIDQGFISGYVARQKGVLAAFSRKRPLITPLEEVRNRYVGKFWDESVLTGVE